MSRRARKYGDADSFPVKSSAKAREKEKAERRQQLLDYIQSADGKGIDVQALCSEFLIPVWADGDNGDKYKRSEVELRSDLGKYLDKEREKAWRAANQAVRAMADPVIT